MLMNWIHRILTTTTGFVIGTLVGVLGGGVMYGTFEPNQTAVAEASAESENSNYSSVAADVTLVRLTDLMENVTPVEEEKAEPAFDPSASHSPDTNLAITRFCNAEGVETSWSIDVDTSVRYFSPDLDTEVLVLTYLTGDWLILTRANDDYCHPIGAEYALDTELLSIEALTAAKP